MKKSKPFNKTLGIILVLALFSFMSFCALFPLSVDMKQSIPEPYDTRLNIWILQWNFHKFQTGLNDFFQGNILYPHPCTLAFSEHLIGVAVVAYPFYLMGMTNPVLMLNFLIFCSFVLSGWGVFLWIRQFNAGWAAALFAGVIFAYSPWRYAQLGHFQLLNIQWLPLSMFFFMKFVKQEKFAFLAPAALFFALQIFSSYYLAFFEMLVLFVYILTLMIFDPGKVKRKSFLRALAVFILLMIPFLALSAPYFKMNEELNVQAPKEMIAGLSASPGDYVIPDPTNIPYRFIHAFIGKQNGHYGPETQLFPGATAWVALLATPLILAFKRRNFKNYIFFILLACISFVLSLGPEWRWGADGKTIIKLPYDYCLRFLPGFGAMRVPSRFALLFQLAAAMTAGLTVDIVLKNIKSAKIKNITGAILVLFAYIETLHAPLSTVKAPAEHQVPSVYPWAKQNNDQIKAVLELPMTHYEYEYVYFSVFHWNPIVNGVSGYYPPTYGRIKKIVNEFPSKKSLDLMRSMKVSHIFVHSHHDQPIDMTGEFAGEYLKLTKKFDETSVYEVIEENAEENRLQILDNLPRRFPANAEISAPAFLINPSPKHNFIVPDRLNIDLSIFSAENTAHASSRKLRIPFHYEPYSILPLSIEWPVLNQTGRYNYRFAWSNDSPWELKGRKEGSVQVICPMEKTQVADVDVFREIYLPVAPVAAGKEFSAEFLIENQDEKIWKKNAQLKLNAAFAWADDKNECYPCRISDREVFSIPHDVFPGQCARLALILETPNSEGSYRLIVKRNDGLIQYSENNVNVQSAFQSLPDGAVLISDKNPQELLYARDSNINTRWTTMEPMSPGFYLKICFSQPRELQSILFKMGSSKNDFPRNLRIECHNENEKPLILKPSFSYDELTNEFTISFPQSEASCFSAVLTEKSEFWWSVHEIMIR